MESWQDNRLSRQIEFVKEIDKLKGVYRRTLIMDGSRHENTAEHTWHIAMLAMVLHEHVPEPKPDLSHVIRLMLVHDIVEIDAGDTFAYDAVGYTDKEEREMAAAKRIFGLLPDDQANEIMSLWREFEEMKTTEAVFAAAMDRMMPVLHNYYTEGHSWKQHSVTRAQVLKRMEPVRLASPKLFAFIEELLQSAVERGILIDAPNGGEG